MMCERERARCTARSCEFCGCCCVSFASTRPSISLRVPRRMPCSLQAALLSGSFSILLRCGLAHFIFPKAAHSSARRSRRVFCTAGPPDRCHAVRKRRHWYHIHNPTGRRGEGPVLRSSAQPQRQALAPLWNIVLPHTRNALPDGHRHVEDHARCLACAHVPVHRIVQRHLPKRIASAQSHA